MKTKTILCFFDTDSGRDIQAMAPILFYLEKRLKFQIIIKYFFETYLIASIKPNMVFLPNCMGSREYNQILKDCHKRHIPAFGLTAEGNIKEEFYKIGINWGWNKDHRIYQDTLCLWSNKSLEMYRTYWPNSDFAKIKVTGGSGFDIYKMASHSNTKKNLFNSNNYKKTIGYAGWAFGKTNSQHNIKILKAQFKEDFENELSWRKKKEREMENILRSAIEQHPEFLFILKKHPKENSSNDLIDVKNEMSSLEIYPNVVYLKDETYALYEIIGCCDVWTCFESTTILEAWLMGIPTINIKPHNKNKYETSIAQGSLKAIDASSFNKLINKLNNSELENLFNHIELLSNREKIIQDSIGFSDGLNHVRIIKELMKSFENPRHSNFSLSKMNIYHKLLMVSMKILTKRNFFLKFEFVKKHYFLFHTFDIKVLNKNLAKNYELIANFYNREHQQTNKIISYETL